MLYVLLFIYFQSKLDTKYKRNKSLANMAVPHHESRLTDEKLPESSKGDWVTEGNHNAHKWAEGVNHTCDIPRCSSGLYFDSRVQTYPTKQFIIEPSSRSEVTKSHLWIVENGKISKVTFRNPIIFS